MTNITVTHKIRNGKLIRPLQRCVIHTREPEDGDSFDALLFIEADPDYVVPPVAGFQMPGDTATGFKYRLIFNDNMLALEPQIECALDKVFTESEAHFQVMAEGINDIQRRADFFYDPSLPCCNLKIICANKTFLDELKSWGKHAAQSHRFIYPHVYKVLAQMLEVETVLISENDRALCRSVEGFKID
jgi:hypothetical protein